MNDSEQMQFLEKIFYFYNKKYSGDELYKKFDTSCREIIIKKDISTKNYAIFCNKNNIDLSFKNNVLSINRCNITINGVPYNTNTRGEVNPCDEVISDKVMSTYWC